MGTGEIVLERLAPTLSLEKASEVGTANRCCFFLINVLFYLTGFEGIFNELFFLLFHL